MARISLSIVVLLSLFINAGCCTNQSPLIRANVVDVMNGGSSAGFARATEPIPFTFPRDHAAHPEFRTEWWYYTGNLQAEDGSQFGYQLTFFRNALTPTLETRPSNWATNQIYMAHFAVSDGRDQQFSSFERYSRAANGLAGAQSEPHYQVWLENWLAESIEPGVMHLKASEMQAGGLIALDLTLQQHRPPLLHGNQGLSPKGPEVGNANYYYSLVQMPTAGTLTFNGKSIAVQGVSWMDHEFGTQALGKDAVGWDWFSVQLENGAVLMFAQVRNQQGISVGDFAGTVAWADGRQQTIQSKDILIEVLNKWISPHSGITYPSGWRVKIPTQQIDLTIEPLIPDQELQVSFLYWEGAVLIQGTMEGGDVLGKGYVELTGYGQTNQEFQR